MKANRMSSVLFITHDDKLNVVRALYDKHDHISFDQYLNEDIDFMRYDMIVVDKRYELDIIDDLESKLIDYDREDDRMVSVFLLQR